MLNVSDPTRLKGFRFPRSVISYAVWAYHRFARKRLVNPLCRRVLL
jgi:transposase-like protein